MEVRWFAVVATVALAVTACSDDGEVDGANSSRRSTTSTETSVSEPPDSSSPTTATDAAAPPTPAVGPDTPVSRSGIGPIQVGMTVRQAEQAAGVTITPGEPIGPGSNCVEAQIGDLEIYLQLAITGAPSEDLEQGVVRMVAGQGVRSTVEGVAVGDPVAEVTATYGAPTRTVDYPYLPQGDVLVFEQGGYAYGVIVDGPTVAQLQSGEATQVPSIEGCV